MYNIRSTTPMTPVDGHVDINFADRLGWIENMGATILPIMMGDDHCGPFVALSYVEPTSTQMPLSFAHAHASDNWRISLRSGEALGEDKGCTPSIPVKLDAGRIYLLRSAVLGQPAPDKAA